MIEIKSLSGISREELYKARNDAFSDYAASWSDEEYDRLLQRRGYNEDLSFGAFDDGRLVSYTLNGIDDHYGTRTAYDTGTGTIKEYRGRGLAGQVFSKSLPYLKEAGIEQYLLEVLCENSAALNVYTQQGFSISRTFNYFIGTVAHEELVLKTPYRFEVIPVQEHPGMREMWDYHPAWQNDLKSIMRQPQHFVAVGVFAKNELVGCGIVEPERGDIPVLAVAQQHRRNGVGSSLLHKLAAYSAGNVRLIYIDERCTAMEEMLKSEGIALSGKQYEMIRML